MRSVVKDGTSWGRNQKGERPSAFLQLAIDGCHQRVDRGPIHGAIELNHRGRLLYHVSVLLRFNRLVFNYGSLEINEACLCTIPNRAGLVLGCHGGFAPISWRRQVTGHLYPAGDENSMCWACDASLSLQIMFCVQFALSSQANCMQTMINGLTRV